jgi:hypothetical protein
MLIHVVFGAYVLQSIFSFFGLLSLCGGNPPPVRRIILGVFFVVLVVVCGLMVDTMFLLSQGV